MNHLLCVFIVLNMVASCLSLSFAQSTTPGRQSSETQDTSPDVLRKSFEAKLKVAELNSDYASELTISKAWNAALPDDKKPKEKLLKLLADGKKYDSAVTLNRPHFDAPDERYVGRLKLGLDLYFAGRDDEVWTRAEKIVDEAKREIAPHWVGRYRNPFDGWSPFRASAAQLGLAGGIELQARVLIRKGEFRKALDAISDGIDASREALDIVKRMPPNEMATAADFQSKEALASLLLQKIRAQIASGSNFFAARTLEEYLSVSREVESHPRYYWNLAVSNYKLRNFRVAEINFRKADILAEQSGYKSLSFFRSDCGQGIVSALEGQRKWGEVKAELDRLDALAGDDETLKYRIRYRFERAYAYLNTGERLEEALTLFQEMLDHSKDGISSAHARGLQGVTLWRLKSNPAGALQLLKDAVGTYLDPLYLDDQALGINADVRDIVIETYLEAMFQTRGEDLMQALGPAEWVRSSTVQSALADAAVRALAKDPALSELVRKDQDLKNEIRNLRNKASAELDSLIGSRINDLNLERAEIQAKIKQSFPDYDNLVAPSPPSIAAAMKELAPDEVLITLLPTDHNVYVWAIAGDGNSAAIAAKISKVELQKRISDFRRTLDFGEMGGSVNPFDTASAYELYRLLLAPLQFLLNGKKHLIVAAGGSLGQIPFGVLLTDKPRTINAASPFLIKQFAISHVPSVGAWLSVKRFAETKRAPESLIAWADPSFGATGVNRNLGGNSVRSLRLNRPELKDDLDGISTKPSISYSRIPALPETRDELIAIASVLKANQAIDLHLGERATKASVFESNASGQLFNKRVVVFATHGLMAGDLPELTQPALALANTDGSDQNIFNNLLLLEDVLGMKLNADWVVLSACNTAAADGKVEEALSGLARGFFYAGSRSLLVTHWAVESESAKELTTKTMMNYVANPEQRKSESLRQAMLTVMANPSYEHPAYWAPYALVGDGGR